MNRKMPLLLRCGMYFSILFVAGSVIAIILMAIGFGTWPIAGGLYDARSAIRLVGPMLVVTGAFMAGIAFGLHHARLWARILILIFWIWIPAYVIAVASLGLISWKSVLRPIIQAAICLPFSWWYLYRRTTVVEYFQRESTSQ